VTVIKLAFFSLLFLGLVTMIAGPVVALVAFIALVVYGVTARKPRQVEQAQPAITDQPVADALLTDQAIAMFCNPN
jgi:hypothetical protein